MMGCPDALRESNPIDKAILDFTFRPANPSIGKTTPKFLMSRKCTRINCPPEGHITWQWITVMPQQVAYNTDGTPEQVCVSVAQN